MRLLTFILGALICFKTYGQDKSSAFVSVKDFGAKGDGKTDDTRAIQNAIDYVQKSGFSMNQIPGSGAKSIYFGAVRNLFFPAGIYIISEPLKVGRYVQFFGEKAVLTPQKGKVNRINGIEAFGWQVQIEGLQFIGFKTAIVINNDNVNIGKVLISNCDFIKNLSSIDLSAQSTITIIRENRFVDNESVLYIHSGDKVIMSENWVEPGTLKGNQPAPIVNRGTLHFLNNLMVPKPPQSGTVEPAWINNYKSVYVSGIRQGGEPGSMTLINNFAAADTKYPIVPNTVIIRDSECYGIYGGKAPNYAPAVIRVFEIPNQIVIDGIRGMTDAKVIDIATSVNKSLLEQNLKALSRDKIQISVDNINGGRFLHNNKTDIPDLLLQFSTN
ncbi:glycosyl hydrolase family 28-related protein [Niabella digestorum]|mgnify:CR=1 FL=1|jgi:Endopolygalacturonase|uniref:Glycosyl hydrolase family 28-related protein n=1 Tax=Niabella digestorum TaxID=3117701 RepID=A0ABU7RFI5_9BACT